MSETIALHFNVIHDEELTAHLRDLGTRLVQHLPPSKLNFRFYLVDLPEVNAFSIAGGRVYVSRKLVAFSRNDDELAGVLAHELGHLVTHQSAIEMTHVFREMLGINQVGDRQDIFRRFHQVIENAAHHPRVKRREEERHQIVADQVAIFALARVGFSPQTLVDFWDRFGELHGKTGTWLSDLFGSTTPEQHRLRYMVKDAASLPPGCTDRSAVLDEADFKTWQSEVVEYSDSRPESLPGVISKHRLTDRLRPDISNLRFSPDGQYALAQDDGGINIASRTPFAFLFYIPAPDASNAQFSPDSQSVNFVTTGLRVESWSIADQKRRSVHEVTLREACLQKELSPDGATLACLSSRRALLLINVVDSSVIFQKKDFYIPSFAEAMALIFRSIGSATEGEDTAEPLRFINIAFSPDNHYLLAAHITPNNGMPAGTSSVLLFNLLHGSEEPVVHSIRSALQIGFAFVGTDRIVGINPSAPQKSPLLKFPTGEKLAEVTLGDGLHLRGATHGDFLLIGPLKDYPLGILDLTTKQMNIVMKKKAADMYDGVFLTERMNGELALNTKEAKAPLGLLQLPESNLGRLKTAAVSPNLSYMAISTRTRGVVWDLAKDSRLLYTRSFNGAGFYDLSFYADYPKFEQSPRQLAHFSLENSNVTANDIKEALSVQHGLYVVNTRPRNRSEASWSNVDVDVQDVRSSQLLWSRYFHSQVPSVNFNPNAGTALFSWRFSDQGVQDEIHSIPNFKPHAEKDDYFCEVIDADVGGLIAYFTVRTNGGSLRFRGGIATRDWAVMEATGDQILTYSLPKGEETGHFFGSDPTISATGLLAVQSESREVTLYELATSQQKQQYTFARPVAFKAFSEDGKRLLVLTNDQTVYMLDTTVSAPTGESVANSGQK